MNVLPLPHGSLPEGTSPRAAGLADGASGPPPTLLAGLTRLAADICAAPIAAITSVDASGQRAHAVHGLPIEAFTLPRAHSLCALTAQGPGLVEVPDTWADARVAATPFVTGGPRVRFYAGAALLDAQGQHTGALCVFDTVPRQLANAQRDALASLAHVVQRLLEADRPTYRLGALLEQSPLASFFFDPVDWRWRYANASALLSLGLSADALTAADPAQHCDDYDASRLRLRLAPLLAGSVATVVVETTHRRADGACFPVEVTFSATLDRGVPTVLAFARDLSERNRVRDALHTRQRFFDMASELFFIVGDDGRIISANDRVATLLGHPPGSLSRRPMADLIQRSNLADASDAFFHCRQDNAPVDAEVWFLRADGQPLLLQLSGRSEPGEPTYIVGRDLTASHAAQRRLRLLEKAFEASDNPFIVAGVDRDPAGLIEYVNPAFERVTGYTPAEAIGRNCAFLQGEDRDQPEIEDMRRALAARTSCRVTLRNYRKDGSLFHNMVHLSPVPGDDGHVSHYIGVLYDVSEVKQQQERILRLDRIHSLVRAVGQCIVREHSEQSLLQEVCDVAVGHGGFPLVWAGIVDPETELLRPSATCGARADVVRSLVVSRRPDGLNGLGLGGMALRSTLPTVCDDIRTANIAEAWRRRAIDSGIASMAYLPIVRHGQTVGLIAFCAGTSTAFDAEETRLLLGIVTEVSFALGAIDQARRIEFLASHDVLTGLPDASTLERRIDATLAPGNVPLAVVMLDIERLKMVNDAFGKRAGDELLRDLAARLASVGGNVELSRLRSGPFVMACAGLESMAAVQRWIESELLQTLTLPFRVNGDVHYVSARCGVAVSPDDGRDGTTLVARAESALLQAKKRGERVVFYSAEMNAHTVQALAIENELRRSIEACEFVLHYQPKLCLVSGVVTGFEALLRWQHPQRGLLAPGLFIGVLEDTGLIAELAPWLLAQAIGDAARINHGRERRLRVAVNVSQVQMRRPDFVETMARELSGMAPAECALDIEITESLLIDNAETAIEKLRQLHELGVGIAIDDFGTGYSSLAYIARLPFNALKIDQSFVRDMAQSRHSRAIVASIVSLARSLDKSSIGEGVETAEQHELLRELGCEQVQGYLHARPMPLSQALAWLAAHEARHPEAPRDGR